MLLFLGDGCQERPGFHSGHTYCTQVICADPCDSVMESAGVDNEHVSNYEHQFMQSLFICFPRDFGDFGILLYILLYMEKITYFQEKPK